MKHLLTYSLFESKNTDDTLYIFDFDQTLVRSPEFEELVIDYLKEDVTIKSLLDKSLKLIGKEKSDLKIEHGRIYISDPKLEIDVKGNWVRKKGRVYLVTPDKFHYSEISFPNSVLKHSELYKSVKNKAIVTARIKSLRPLVEKYLDRLGLGLPNFGLFMYPLKEADGSRVAIWKAKTVVSLIKDSGFKKAEFFDDRPKIVKAVQKLVERELPEVEFKVHRVVDGNSSVVNESTLVQPDDSESKKYFVEEIKDIFFDEVIDNTNIEELPESDEYDLPGIYYYFNDYALRFDRPYLSICIWSGQNHFDRLLKMSSYIEDFIIRVESAGYQCRVMDSIVTGSEIDSVELFLVDYIQYANQNPDCQPFRIDVYYK